MTTPSQAFAEHGGAVLATLLAGVSAADAAEKHGITERTIARWLQRGREHSDGPYGDFAKAVDAARADVHHGGHESKPMDEAELVRVVSERARQGSVQAMKLRWDMLRGREARPAQTGGILDELEQRRAQRT
jgi:transposase